MKKLSILFMFVAFGIILTTSCGKEELGDPTISFQGNKTSITFPTESSIDVNITFDAPGKIESVTMVQPTTTGSQTVDITKKMGLTYSDNGSGEASAVYFFKVSDTTLAMLLATNTSLTYTFTLVDQEAKETSATFTVTKASAGTPLSVSKSGTMYHISGVNPGAWDLDGDAAVTVSGSGAIKSMKNTDAAGVTFTGSWESATQNGTMYVKSNSFNFTSATEEAAAVAYAAGTPSASVANPAIGDIYIGKKGTTYYAIKITNFDITSKGNLGKLSFDYKKK